MKEGGHHVVDQMGAVGLQVRGVDDALIGDLLGQGLLPEEGDPAAEDGEEEDEG